MMKLFLRLLPLMTLSFLLGGLACGCDSPPAPSASPSPELPSASPSPESSSPYGDVVFEEAGDRAAELLGNMAAWAKVLRTKADFDAFSAKINLSEHLATLWDETFFAGNDLLFVVFGTNSMHRHALSGLKKEDDRQVVVFDEMIPETSTLLLVYQTVFIEVEKDFLNGLPIEIKFNRIIGE